MLPVVILLLSIIFAAFFYRLLPVEVAYRFQSDGSPDEWVSRGAIILWTLLPQFILTLLAGLITLGITKLSGRFKQSESIGIKPEKVLLLMGNMIVMPQVIICFAMVDIFSYNSYQIHLMPLWLFALIVIAVGSIILGIFFLQAIRHVWRVSKE